MSRRPQKRLYALQNAHHEKLKILVKFPGTRNDEAALHRRFADHRIKGEWFQRCPALDAFIENKRRGLPIEECEVDEVEAWIRRHEARR
jgi:hypothetical protein